MSLLALEVLSVSTLHKLKKAEKGCFAQLGGKLAQR